MAAVPGAREPGSSSVQEMAVVPRSNKRLRTVLVCGGCMMALGAVMALVDGLKADGVLASQPLSLEQSVALGKMQEQLKEDSGRLQSVVSLFDKVKREQTELRVKEEDLNSKESSIRSAVHEARNSVVALKYKIHNMKTEAFSNQMFSDADHRRKEAEQRLALKKLALDKEAQGTEQTASTGSVEQSRAPSSVAPRPETAAPASAPAPHSALHPAAPAPKAQVSTAPAPRVEVRVPQPAPAIEQHTYPRTVVYEEPIAPQQQQQQQRVVVDRVEQPLSQRASSAAQRAEYAQRQAYRRSSEFLQAQQAAQARQYAMGLMPMPQLPALHPLGPEASGP